MKEYLELPAGWTAIHCIETLQLKGPGRLRAAIVAPLNLESREWWAAAARAAIAAASSSAVVAQTYTPVRIGTAAFTVHEVVIQNLAAAVGRGSGNRARRRMRAVRSQWHRLKLSELKAG